MIERGDNMPFTFGIITWIFFAASVTILACLNPDKSWRYACQAYSRVPMNWTQVDYMNRSCTTALDGDTIHILAENATFRLGGVDAPETDKAHPIADIHKGQPFSDAARAYLSACAAAKNINLSDITYTPARLSVKLRDELNRPIVVVYPQGAARHYGNSCNYRMVELGLAHYHPSSKLPTEFASILAEAERRAQSAKRGLWALDDPQLPATYRARAKVAATLVEASR